MHIGHLDGKGIVYDEVGQPLLAKGEHLLSHTQGDNIDVSEGSGYWNMRVLFSRTPEKGDLYVTDKRLIFVRKPDPALALRAYNYPAGIGDGIADAYRAQSLKKAGAFMYCEILLEEVEGFWVSKGKAAALFLRTDPKTTRKVILTRRDRNDSKFGILRDLLQTRLPLTKPEDKKGSYVLGAKYPFLHRRA